MAGPGAKGGMWSKGSNGKRVLITKKMARQMASSEMSAQTDEEYADQASKLRQQNNAEAKAKRKADVEKRTIKETNSNELSTDKSKWAKERPNQTLVDPEQIKGVKNTTKKLTQEDKLIEETGFPKDLPVLLKNSNQKARAMVSFEAMDSSNTALQVYKKMEKEGSSRATDLPVFIANREDASKLKRQQSILKEIDSLNKPDMKASKGLFKKGKKYLNDQVEKKNQFSLNDIDNITNNKSAKFSKKENQLIDKLANSILETGALLRPIPTVQTRVDGRARALGNPLLLEAARRAQKKDPRRAEAINTYSIVDSKQYNAYKRQGKSRG